MKVEITIQTRSVWIEFVESANRAAALSSLIRHLRDQKIPVGFACDVLSRASLRVDIVPTNSETRRQDMDAAFSHVVGSVCLWATRMRADIAHLKSPETVKDADWILDVNEQGIVSWRAHR